LEDILKRVEIIIEHLRPFWPDNQLPPKTHEILYNSLYTVLSAGRPVSDIPTLLRDEQYRHQLIQKVNSPSVLNFWQVYDAMAFKYRREMIEGLLNRLSKAFSDHAL
jgi:hypothetical protein